MKACGSRRTGIQSGTCIDCSASRYASGDPRSKKKLAVDEPPVGGTRSLHHGLRQGRVAVDDPRHLGVAALQRLRVDELLDELGGPRADDVAADQLAVALVADDLDHAAAVAVDGARAHRAVLHLA